MFKYILSIGLFLIFSTFGFSQFDLPSNTMKLESTTSPMNSNNEYKIPARNTPALTVPKTPKPKSNTTLGEKEENDFSMVDDRFIEHKSDITPKYFLKDKEIKPEYGKDMYLGDFKTTANVVSILYRDHEYVDGDRVRIFVNDDMVMANVRLEGHFQGFDTPLQDGFNKIEFQALNQGTSGPNTAQLQIRDEAGNILASYEWNLLTGNKATAIIVKQ